MNYEYLKHRMDRFFEETSTEELINKFEALGHQFIDSSVQYKSPEVYQDIVLLCPQVKPSVWRNLLNILSSKDKMQSLNKFEAFLCKIAS